MGNSTTSDRYWNLDTVAVIAATGVDVIVRKIVFYPGSAADVAVIQEYDATGTLRTAMRIKANPADTALVSLDWDNQGRLLNGFKLSEITAGSLDVYLGKN